MLTQLVISQLLLSVAADPATAPLYHRWPWPRKQAIGVSCDSKKEHVQKFVAELAAPDTRLKVLIPLAYDPERVVRYVVACQLFGYGRAVHVGL